MITEAPKQPDQPPLIPDDKKPEPVIEIDWDAIKKAGDENQKDLKKDREEEKEPYWQK
jgi:hypothetical protein